MAAYYHVLNTNFDEALVKGHIDLVITQGYTKCIFVLTDYNDLTKLYTLVDSYTGNIELDVIVENLPVDATKFNSVKVLSRDLSQSHIDYIEANINTLIMCQVNDTTTNTVVANYNLLSDATKARVKLYTFTILPHTTFFRPEIELPENKAKIEALIDGGKTPNSVKIPQKNVISINYDTDQVFNVINYTNILPVTDANIISVINDFKVLSN